MTDARTAAFTICSNNYLHSARTLMESVGNVHPDWDRHLILVDEADGHFDRSREPFNVIQADELGLPDERKFFFRYTQLELNTAVKPWAFEHLFASDGYDRVIYFDPDIFLYTPLVELVHALDKGNNIVLTPHLTGPLDDDKRPTELEIIRSGTWNLGFMAARGGKVVSDLLRWWQQKLEFNCEVDHRSGLFVDQKWMELAPGMFPGVFNLRHEGYNVAYWNLKHRRVESQDDRTMVNGQPLRFFHFSGLDPADPSAFSKHQDRFDLHSVGTVVRELAHDYCAALHRYGYEVCSAWPYAYSTFSDGSPILPAFSAYYRNHEEIQEAADGDPFELGVEFFNRPCEPGDSREPLISHAVRGVWEFFPKIRALYPDLLGEDRVGFASAYVERLSHQIGIPDAYVSPVALSMPYVGIHAPWRSELGSGYAWMTSQCLLRDLPRAARGDRLRIKGNFWHDMHKPAGHDRISLEFFIDDRSIGVLEISEDGGFERSLSVPEDVAEGSTLVIRADHAVVPAEYGLSDDTREISIQIASVCLGDATVLDLRSGADGHGGAFPDSRGWALRWRARLKSVPILGRVLRRVWRQARLLVSGHTAAGSRGECAERRGAATEEAFDRGESSTADLKATRALGRRCRQLVASYHGFFEVAGGEEASGRCWMGRSAAVRLPKAEPGHDLTLVLEATMDLHQHAGNDEVILVASVDDEPLGTVCIRHPGIQKRRLTLPRGTSDASCLRLYAKQTFVPAEIGISEDGRELSVFVHRVELAGRPILDFSSFPYFKLGAAEVCVGVNIVGYLKSELGVGQAARSSARIAEAAGIEHSLVNFDGGCSSRAEDESLSGRLCEGMPHKVNLIHVNADQSHLLPAAFGEGMLRDHYNIAVWYWELPEFPDRWLWSFDDYDEIWAATEFVREAIGEKAAVPVLRMPPAIRFETSAELDRGLFGLPDDKFLFLVMYDMHSFQARKNPQAAVEAFVRAFEGRSDAALVLKTMNVAQHPDEYAELKERLRSAPASVLIDRTLSRQEVYDLEAVCDCFVSLHRSEGFGLGLAESMYLGRPVIGTYWSGNVDFMDHQNSCPVDYELTELDRSYGPYDKGQVWAEPDVDQAARYMRKLVDDRGYFREIAEAGQRTIREQYSPEAIGARVRRRLQAIQRFL